MNFRKELVSVVDIDCSQEKQEIKYYMLNEERTGLTECTYGIEIVKTTHLGKEDIKTINDISICQNYVQEILSKFIRNKVTPCVANEILDDMIGVIT